MQEIVRTNDMVLISFIEALLRDSAIEHQVLDQSMSVMDGSLGILQRRIVVADEEVERARRLLVDAGIGHELRPPSRGPG